MKKWLSILLSSIMLVTAVPFVSAEEPIFDAERSLDALYDNAEDYPYTTEDELFTTDELNSNPELLEAFLEGNYNNAEVISTTRTAEVEQVWAQMAELTMEVNLLRDTQAAAQQLESCLLQLQGTDTDKEPVQQDTAIVVLRERLNSQLATLNENEVSALLDEYENYDAAALDQRIVQCCAEYEALELQLEALGAVPTQEELEQTLFSMQEITTRAAPPDFSMVEGVYSLLKTYCTISVGGKQYTTYTVEVQDKPTGHRMYQVNDSIYMYRVNTIDPNSANRFLANAFEASVAGGVGAFVAPYLGKFGAEASKWFVKAIFDLIGSSETEVTALQTDQPVYKIDNSNTSQMKYVYVQESNGGWKLTNAANEARIAEKHLFYYKYYNCVTGVNEPKQSDMNVDTLLPGRYSSAEVDAVNYYHGYSGQFNGHIRSTVGSLRYIGKNNGKEYTTVVTPFYAYLPVNLL